GVIPWILIVGSAVLTVLLVLEILKRDMAPWPVIILGATALGALLLIIRLLFNPIEGSNFIESAGGSVGRGFGLYLSVISGIVAAVGGYLNFTASGGNLSELGKSVQSRVNSGSNSNDAPPPPPPADAPPPPPPAP